LSHSSDNAQSDRKLDDEWLDWDGSIEQSASSRKTVFFSVTAVAVTFLIGAIFLALWLIQPRIVSISAPLFTVLKWAAFIFSGVVIAWFLLFTASTLAGGSILGQLLIIPRAVNWLLNLAIRVGHVLGVNTDKLVNSFLRVHNLLLPGQKIISPEDLMVLTPRCLNRESNQFLRELRDRYQFKMVVAGGGQEARTKIQEMRPKAIVAIACERDLLSGFVEVNPSIRVVGIPNTRPEGPCKNTAVNREELESVIRKFIALKAN